MLFKYESSLFLGYNSGKVILVDVENHQTLHTLELKSEIVSLNWTQNTKESYDDFDDLQGNTKLVRSSIIEKTMYFSSKN